MKRRLLYILLISFVIFSISSCEDFEVETPVASFKTLKALSPTEYEEASTFQVGEDVFVENTGTGEIFTVFTGDKGHDGSSETYMDDGVEKTNTGFNMNHPREESYFSYTYNTAGTYTITVIAISTDNEGTEIMQNRSTKDITIVD